MEKQRITRVPGFIKRLLISFSISTLFIFNLFAQRLSYSEIKKLEFKTVETDSFFINTDIQFEVTIPKISPTNVTVLQNGKIQENVNFKSMKKFENYTEGGTKIQIWYSFDSEGEYTLAPLKVSIQGKKTSIKFQPVTISEDPAQMPPRIVLKFSNGEKIKSDDILKEEAVFSIPVGQKIGFTVYLQYISQLVQFNFDIPKDSIYEQTKTYEITEVKYREKSISNDLIPVADFQWTGLTEGNHIIPKIKMKVIDYDGYKTDLILPEFIVNFVSKDSIKKVDKNENIFDDAFEEPFIETSTVKKISITPEQCEELASLYKKERKSLFINFKHVKDRKNFEEQLGLPATKGSFNAGALYLSFILIVTFIILLIFAIRKKQVFRVFIFSILLFLSSILLFFTIQNRNHVYGVTKGCTVYSIPEENAEASSEIAAGNLVNITETAGNWYYVQLGETSGWCTKDNIIIIK